MSSETRPGMSLDVTSEGTTKSPYSVFREFRLGAADDVDSPAVYYVRIESHEVAPRHAHPGWTINVVVEGSCQLADIPGSVLKPGHVLTCAPHVQYGPITPGPEGVTLFEIFDSMEARTPIWDDPAEPASAGYEKWIRESFGENWNKV